MLISFKIYGDYKKWKKLISFNKAKLIPPIYKIKEGDGLSYIPPRQKILFNRKGTPYIVKKGDTLQMRNSFWLGMENYGG